MQRKVGVAEMSFAVLWGKVFERINPQSGRQRAVKEGEADEPGGADEILHGAAFLTGTLGTARVNCGWWRGARKACARLLRPFIG